MMRKLDSHSYSRSLVFQKWLTEEDEERSGDAPSTMLRVTEIFRSIQGESTHAGRPCTFVRLSGCPMRCVWCDSEYTFTGGEHISIEDVMKKVRDFGCRLVEVTGGEPLAQREALDL